MGRYYPLCLSLAGRECLVVGGGRVAWRKAQSLIETGAHVTVVSPEFCGEMPHLDGVRLVQRPFREEDVVGATLAVAATSDPEVNRAVARAARQEGVLVNVVDTPEECDFIVPATLVRGDLTISICTGSAAPALARRLRLDFEALIPEAYADFVALLGELRREAIRHVPDASQRHAILTQLASRPTWDLFAQQGPDAVRALAHRLIQNVL